MRQNIKNQSENELSLIVLNDESLYNDRRFILRDIEQKRPSILAGLFEYTEEQLNILAQDIRDDLEGK